eukprot:1086859-Rhodomonas_salina.1
MWFLVFEFAAHAMSVPELVGCIPHTLRQYRSSRREMQSVNYTRFQYKGGRREIQCVSPVAHRQIQ